MKALIVVDVQNDFLPGGALAVPRGDEVVPAINRLLSRFDVVVATQDWHPAGHGSFASSHEGRGTGEIIELNGLSQILWPDHCVQNTPGASFASGLAVDHFTTIVRKGTDPAVDSYSGFFDNGRRTDTGLHAWLGKHSVTELHITGLATDYCVYFTAKDALDLGYTVFLYREAMRGVNLRHGDDSRALDELAGLGATLV